jgi:hypothetical protein
MRHYLALAVDLGWVALSAMLAVLMRDNFLPYEPHLEAITACTAIAVALFTSWRRIGQGLLGFALVGDMPHYELAFFVCRDNAKWNLAGSLQVSEKRARNSKVHFATTA